MAQFDFFGTFNDNWALLSRVIEAVRPVLIPDKWYRESNPAIYTDLNDELKSELQKKRRVFVFPSDAQIFPEHGMKLHPSGPMPGWHTVQHNELGDSVDLTLPACFDRDRQTWLGS